MPVNYIDGATIKGTSYDLHDPRTDHKAEVDGSYADLTAGNAEQIVSTVGIEDKVPYVFRTSGGNADIGDREEDTVVGGSVVWNQQVQNGDFSSDTNWRVSAGTKSIANNVLTYTRSENASGASQIFQLINTIPVGHVCLATCETKVTANSTRTITMRIGTLANVRTNTVGSTWASISAIKAADQTNLEFNIYGNDASQWVSGDKIEIRNANCFDLTAMFGSTIADYLASLETATSGAGVAWFRKLFPKTYYAYNAGTLMHVQTSGHDMTGFNQWDEDWEVGEINGTTGANANTGSAIRSKNYIPVVGGQTYYAKVGSSWINVYQYETNDASGYIGQVASPTNATFTLSDKCRYIRFATGTAYGTTYNHDICINFHWDGERDGEYEPYILHSYALDSDLVLRGIPKLDSNNSLYYDGDVYSPDGTVTRRYGIVDLGTLTWTYRTSGTDVAPYFYASFDGIKSYGNPASNTINAICAKYKVVARNTTAFDDKAICGDGSTTAISQIQIKDSAYTDAATFKTAMSGVYLVYELATPTTESADPYTAIQVVDNWGTETYVDAGTRDVEIPVGHETKYLQDLRAKLETAPDAPNGDGDYIVRQTNGQNEYVQLVIPAELPTNPSEDGAYVLKATVTNGTTVLSWEVQA